MCLEIKKLSFKRKARKDIYVYKQISSFVIDEGKIMYVTPYRESLVVIGEVYKSEIYRDRNTIEQGLHSFAKITDCFDNSRRIYNHPIYYKGKDYPVTPVLVECVIPKGARYYKGVFDGRFTSYASDTLEYVRILKFS